MSVFPRIVWMEASAGEPARLQDTSGPDPLVPRTSRSRAANAPSHNDDYVLYSFGVLSLGWLRFLLLRHFFFFFFFLHVQLRIAQQPRRSLQTLMPVIRFPNFTDRTGDVPADVLRPRRQRAARRQPPQRPAHRRAEEPEGVRREAGLHPRRRQPARARATSHFLVSAQAVFLPIPKSGKAEFNPVLFNYQSAPGSPAVLTDPRHPPGHEHAGHREQAPRTRPRAGWGQELYFNNKGQRAAFTAERKSDVEAAHRGAGRARRPRTTRARSQKGADVLFLVQVPLEARATRAARRRAARRPRRWRRGARGGRADAAPRPKPAAVDGRRQRRATSSRRCSVTGRTSARSTRAMGSASSAIRSSRSASPCSSTRRRATASSSDIDLDSIARSIGSVYEHADFVGSLVMPDGDPRRPTAWQKVPHEWPAAMLIIAFGATLLPARSASKANPNVLLRVQ